MCNDILIYNLVELQLYNKSTR